MSGFEMYHEEYFKPFIPSLDMLKKCNVMFSPNLTFFEKYWRFLYMLPMVTLHYISLSMYIVNLFVEGNDPFERADMIPVWLIMTEYWFKMVLLMIKREEIRDVIDNLNSMWRTDGINQNQIKLKNEKLKQLHYGDIVFNKIGQAMTWQYLLVPLYETIIRRLILNQDCELRLPFACVYPFEITNWAMYLALYAFQSYNTFFAANTYLGVGWLLVVLTSHLNVQFLLLQEDLIHIKPTRTEKEKNDSYVENPYDEIKEGYERSELQIKDFVKLHQKALMLTDKLNSSCNKLTFTILAFTTLIISFFAVAAKVCTGTAYAINNYGAIMVLMSNIFILCYCSQLLSSSSSGIAVAAAKNLWYKGDLQYQTSICFIILRSQKPCCWTIASTPIGLETFNKVLKTTWSYFSLASHIYDERD